MGGGIICPLRIRVNSVLNVEMLVGAFDQEKALALAWRDYIWSMEAQDGLKTIVPPLFLNIFFYFLLV